ncbi:dendritic cell-specific transmembrane protein [Dryobates pubescens]|uniref:dendritic cell-specific transmembrane protein n=1 Tax=Dryobates pubescens TaxID=118200 RepID=UPI0023B97868|nr:dendritic cell-specific transmembrane protein [Dryobates pubescens]
MGRFVAIAQEAWGVFISQRKPGWKYLMQLFAVCSVVGFFASFLLFLGMHFSLAHPSLGPLLVSGLIWLLLSVALSCFRPLRCFSALFLLSCGLRSGRNALLTAGTGVVVAGNIQNIFHNLKILADSITCHLEYEQFNLIKYYVKAVKWIYEAAKLPSELSGLLGDEFTPSYSIEDDALKQELNSTKQEIQRVVNQVSFMLTLLPWVGQKILPMVGIFLASFGTGLFIKKFVGPCSDRFMNTYITKQFIAFDEHQKQQQRPCLLPLNRKERKKYVAVPSLRLTEKDRKNMQYFFLPVIVNLCIWLLFAAVDHLFYWLITSVNKHLQEVPDLEIQFVLFQQKNRNGFLFGMEDHIVKTDPFKISVFKHNCIPQPLLTASTTWIQLGVIIFFLIIFGLFSGLLTQLKILISASFYPDSEMKRIHHLHAKLLRKRAKLPEKPGSKAFARTVHFWFPILKARKAVGKKECGNGQHAVKETK